MRFGSMLSTILKGINMQRLNTAMFNFPCLILPQADLWLQIYISQIYPKYHYGWFQ